MTTRQGQQKTAIQQDDDNVNKTATRQNNQQQEKRQWFKEYRWQKQGNTMAEKDNDDRGERGKGEGIGAMRSWPTTWYTTINIERRGHVGGGWLGGRNVRGAAVADNERWDDKKNRRWRLDDGDRWINQVKNVFMIHFNVNANNEIYMMWRCLFLLYIYLIL